MNQNKKLTPTENVHRRIPCGKKNKIERMKKITPIIFSLFMLLSFRATCLPKLSSFPSARATIFLDFDGQFVQSSSWNGGNSFYCTPSGLNDTQITEVFNRVAEDYRPFNINITTDSTVFLNAPLAQRIRIIVTLTSAWYQNVGGVSFTRSFTWGDDTPGFVFPDRLGYTPKNIAECCTHESGHTVGLSHQAKYNGTCTLIATYNDGVGSGQTGWAPVMGNSYGRNLSGWNNGPTPSGCTADQDNLSIITSINGFTYRPDDHSDDPASNPTLLVAENEQLSQSGIITTNTDKDVFKININKDGLLHLNVNPFSVGPDNEGADLDVKVTVLAADYSVINTYDPLDALNVTIDTTLNSGTYYIMVQGAGNLNTSNYGSLGSYTLTGTITPTGTLAIRDVKLNGKVSNGKHSLSWNIVSDEPVKSIEIESSEDGRNFSTFTRPATANSLFTYSPTVTGIIYYRLKVTSIKGETVYSNIISLKNSGKPSVVLLSNLIQGQINLQASENFSYRLADMSGRMLKEGKGSIGTNLINIDNSPNGIYIIQMNCNSQSITERIVKL